MDDQQVEIHRRRTQKDYSLAFKLAVVADVEKGHLTWKQAQRRHGIQGRSTVLVWLRKHGTLDWKSKQGMKEASTTPAARIRELEAQIKRLEAEKRVLNQAIDLADAMFATDIRKKCLPLSSIKAGQGQQNQVQPEG